MATILGPNSGTIEETVGFTIKTDVYGMDVLTRPFIGAASDWTRFRALYTKDTADSTYPDYYFTGADVTNQRGSVISATLTFKGIRSIANGGTGFSQGQVTAGLVRKTITLKLGDGSGRTLEAEYLAPSTTWKYSAEEEPTSPRHRGAMRAFEDSFRIVKTRGATQFPIQFLTTRQTFPSSEVYFVYTSIYTEAFDKAQEGKAWTVTERNDGVIYAVEDLNTGLSDRPSVVVGTL